MEWSEEKGAAAAAAAVRICRDFDRLSTTGVNSANITSSTTGVVVVVLFLFAVGTHVVIYMVRGLETKIKYLSQPSTSS